VLAALGANQVRSAQAVANALAGAPLQQTANQTLSPIAEFGANHPEDTPAPNISDPANSADRTAPPPAPRGQLAPLGRNSTRAAPRRAAPARPRPEARCHGPAPPANPLMLRFASQACCAAQLVGFAECPAPCPSFLGDTERGTCLVFMSPSKEPLREGPTPERCARNQKHKMKIDLTLNQAVTIENSLRSNIRQCAAHAMRYRDPNANPQRISLFWKMTLSDLAVEYIDFHRKITAAWSSTKPGR